MVTQTFPDAFQDPEPNISYELGPDLTNDLRQHMKDPQLIIGPIITDPIKKDATKSSE